MDAHLAGAGTLIDCDELADAIATFGLLEEVIQANPFALVYQVLLRLEKARVAAAALDDWDDVFATVRVVTVGRCRSLRAAGFLPAAQTAHPIWVWSAHPAPGLTDAMASPDDRTRMHDQQPPKGS
jgi:hypothetical protein